MGRGHLAGGLLAAVLVMELDIALLFGRDGVDGLLVGKWAGVTEWLVDWFLEWLEWSVIFGLFALVPGLVGASCGRRAGARGSCAR